MGSAPLLLLLAITLFLGGAAAFGGGHAGSASTTDLQKHVAFFDKNGDGIVSISETYDAFLAFGFNAAAAGASSAFINGALSGKTRPANAAANLDIYIENIQKGIHGSDSGSYDAEGRFVPEKFEDIFSKHGKTVPNALTSKELDEMLKVNRKPGDFAGWAGSASEWKILYGLAKDKDGLLHKDVVRGVYDGSLFPKLVKAKASGDN